MKEKEDSGFTSEMQEPKVIKDEKDRSRGKRRTAREIAQMFEQLKQRHLARKKEWHSEKQELLKQASIAEESKFLLVELKCLLEELKNQLGNEEKKRIQVEEEFERAATDWKAEKDGLLKIITNLESKSLGGISHDHRNLNEELDAVKTRLVAREKDIALIKKSNADFQKSTQEIQRKYEAEKQNIVNIHEGEKRNWEKTRQVMLDKIDMLQEELRNSRISSFPLHGSHVGSPFDDAISGLPSSPEMEEYYSTESKTPITTRINNAPATVSEATDSSFGYIQRSVDEALNQIEKMTQGLRHSKIDESDHVTTSVGSTSIKLSPHTSSSAANSSRLLSIDTSPLQINEGNKLKREDKKQRLMSSVNPLSDNSASQYSSLSCSKQKEHQKFSNNTENLSQDSCKVSASPETSLSPSESCSIPTFTESSADSPQVPPISKSKELSRSTQTQKRCKQTSPLSIDKNCLKQGHKVSKKSSTEGPTTKQLPNLHQRLLFGNASKFGASHKNCLLHDHATSDKNRSHMDCSLCSASATSTSPKKNHQNIFAEKTKEIAEPENTEYAPKKQDCVRKQMSSKSVNFIKERTTNMQNHTEVADKNSFDNIVGPPVRPKPSVIIEKDTKGNVLCVISDSKNPCHDQRRKLESLDEIQPGGRRRRSQEVVYDLKPLVVDKADLKLNKQTKLQDKEGFKSRGKNWIKKRLSFLESPQKEDGVLSKATNKVERPNGKTRAFYSRKEGRKSMLEISSSEESDNVSEVILRRFGRKDATEKRGKPKRYTRSKTDSNVDVKNLLSKFKASQFSSKKPFIVKEFEKKLLKNEVKTLQKEKQNQSSAKTREGLRVTQTDREKHFEDDDGYRGEDELDYHMHKRKEKSTMLHAPSSGTLVRSPSIRSLQEQLFGSIDPPRRHFHGSMINLASENLLLEPLSEHMNSSTILTKKSLSPTKAEHPKTTVQENMPKDKTPFYCSRSYLSDDHTLQNSELAIATNKSVRKSSNHLALPEPKPGVRFGKKRLSWAANLQQSFEDSPNRTPSPTPQNLQSSDRITTSAVCGILLKPKSTDHDAANFTTNLSESNKQDSIKNKERMSQDMKAKADNLEKVLRKGPKASKARRYKRSETQPIAWSPSAEENDSDCNLFQGMVRSQSMTSEMFTKV